MADTFSEQSRKILTQLLEALGDTVQAQIAATQSYASAVEQYSSNLAALTLVHDDMTSLRSSLNGLKGFIDHEQYALLLEMRDLLKKLVG